jgi:hypothetical protein
MKTCVSAYVAPLIIKTQHLMEVNGQFHALAALPREEESPGTHRIEVWVSLHPVWTR